jgi:predicted deacylase
MSQMSTGTKTINRHLLPVSSMGNERTLTVVQYGPRDKVKKAYIHAGLHADEAPGFLVMHYLLDMLDQADAANTIDEQIMIVPVANPIGVSQWRDEALQGRFDFFNNINFNRRHLDLTAKIADQIKDELSDAPEENVALIRKAAGDVLSSMAPKDEAEYLKHLLLQLSYDADIVLDLHCDEEALMHVYLGTPLWPDAADLSAQLGAEVTLLAEDSGVTPFDEACSRIWWQLARKFPDHPIPSACLSATIELRGRSDTSHELAARDAENILVFLQRRGWIRGDAPALPPLPNEATSLRAVEQVKAPAAGVVVFLKNPGDIIAEGEMLAEIVNPLEIDPAQRLVAVKSSTEGILFSVNTDRFARPGRILAKIAGKKPLKEKGEDLLTS